MIAAIALAVLVGATALVGQQPAVGTAQPGAPAAETSVPPVVLSVYAEGVSRGAFAACDGNGDDRLSFIEAARTLDAVRDLRDVAGFRRLDRNSDGYIDWPEFDARFRELSARAVPLRITPGRPFDPKAAEPRAPATAAGEEKDPAATMLAALDSNGDGAIGTDEAAEALRAVGVSTTFLSQFSRLDLDASGDLSADELAPLAPLLPTIGLSPTTAPSPARASDAGALPAGYREADANGDGVLDRAELGAALAAVDPTLVRWVPRIVADADQTRNGTLGPLEITNAERRAASER